MKGLRMLLHGVSLSAGSVFLFFHPLENWNMVVMVGLVIAILLLDIYDEEPFRRK